MGAIITNAIAYFRKLMGSHIEALNVINLKPYIVKRK